MSGSKLQIALVAGLMITAGAALHAGIPRLRNDTGLLYLRAQYKLATGDTGSALQLMQQAAGLQRQEAVVPACPQAQTKSVAQTARLKPAVRTVSLRSANAPRVRQVRINFIDTWSAEHVRMMARLKARQAEQQRELQVTLARVHAQLKDLPVPVSLPAVAIPATPVALQ